MFDQKNYKTDGAFICNALHLFLKYVQFKEIKKICCQFEDEIGIKPFLK